MSDRFGVQVASNLTEELRYEAKLENAKKPDALRRAIIEKLVELYEKDGNYDEQPFPRWFDSHALCRSQWCWENNFYREIGSSLQTSWQESHMLVACDTFLVPLPS